MFVFYTQSAVQTDQSFVYLCDHFFPFFDVYSNFTLISSFVFKEEINLFVNFTQYSFNSILYMECKQKLSLRKEFLQHSLISYSNLENDALPWLSCYILSLNSEIKYFNILSLFFLYQLNLYGLHLKVISCEYFRGRDGFIIFINRSVSFSLETFKPFCLWNYQCYEIL